MNRTLTQITLMLSCSLLLSGSALAADVERGKQVFSANCMACHGTEGDGNGPAAMALDPKPADFTQAAFWDGRTDQALATTIKTGKPGTPMAPFPQLTDSDMADLVAYMNTFKP